MRVKMRVFLFLYSFILIISNFAHGTNFNKYFALPPFLSTTVPPNVLFLVDVSGSMYESAYNPNKFGKYYCLDPINGCGNQYRGDEEGYFVPDAVYQFNPETFTWEITNGTPDACPKSIVDLFPSDIADSIKNLWNSNLGYTSAFIESLMFFVEDFIENEDIASYVYNRYFEDEDFYLLKFDSHKKYLGSCLNYLLMSRYDLLRWAITGGRPKYCGFISDPNAAPNKDPNCDPELSVYCQGDSCILETSMHIIDLTTPQRTWIQVPKSRIDGIIEKLRKLSVKPRLGVMFFNGIPTGRKVYIGDYPYVSSASDADPEHPYCIKLRMSGAILWTPEKRQYMLETSLKIQY
jgi:type IV pilus assembly protein PilY1